MTLIPAKRIIPAYFLFLLFIGGKTSAQSFAFDGKVPSLSGTNHMTAFTYGFDRSYMVITNEHAKEPALKIIPTYINYPYATRKFQLYGPTLGFTITSNGNSS